MKNIFNIAGIGAVAALFIPVGVYAGQPLETETARLPKAHITEVEATYEWQTSSEGKEMAAPMAIAYGVTDRMELLVEPVFYTAIRPKVGAKATGPGDMETTLTYIVGQETGKMPALALAAEVKIPTAKNSLIGTKKTDYSGTLIASKLFGKFDTHFNVSYSVLGEPTGVKLSNVFSFALAGEYFLNKQWDLLGEILTTTDAHAKAVAGGMVSQEIAGAETVGMLGTRYHLSPAFTLAFGVTYDNNNALLLRPGMTYKF